ncbi:MAG TPA: hypothetical protein VM598_06315, partial [Bdellovibrionota bacterium]|nr:hypothetical protein [Bdellovibrionota bacterium]
MDNEMNGTKPSVDNVRDATDRFVSDAKSQVNTVIDEAAEMANDLFGKAEQWIGSSDSSRVIGLVAVVAAAGFLGYLIGR